MLSHCVHIYIYLFIYLRVYVACIGTSIHPYIHTRRHADICLPLFILVAAAGIRSGFAALEAGGALQHMDAWSRRKLPRVSGLNGLGV